MRGDEHEPLKWDQLVRYEKEQGGYWFYPSGCDVYGEGKVFVRVAADPAGDKEQ